MKFEISYETVKNILISIDTVMGVTLIVYLLLHFGVIHLERQYLFLKSRILMIFLVGIVVVIAIGIKALRRVLVKSFSELETIKEEINTLLSEYPLRAIIAGILMILWVISWISITLIFPLYYSWYIHEGSITQF